MLRDFVTGWEVLACLAGPIWFSLVITLWSL
jgi:hypothetical protein